jgi:hypothetical protein
LDNSYCWRRDMNKATQKVRGRIKGVRYIFNDLCLIMIVSLRILTLF